MLDELLAEKFDREVEQGTQIKGYLIELWCNQFRIELGIDNSHLVSKTYLNNFKRRKNIVSRKITKFYSKKEAKDKIRNDENGAKFVNEVNELIKNNVYLKNKIFNSDQMGIQYEMYHKRSLTYRGKTTVESAVQSKHATTHSFTIQVNKIKNNHFGKFLTKI